MKSHINEPGDWEDAVVETVPIFSGSAHSVKEEAPGGVVDLPNRAGIGFLGPREFQKRRAEKRVYRGPLH